MSANVIPLRSDDDQPDHRRASATGPARTAPNWHARQANARKEWQAMRDLAVTIACPPPPHGCGMPIGAACVNRSPRRTPTVLKRFPAHTARINLAKGQTR